MQTTLRLDDDLYREAKAEAARSGMTLTRFLEEALRLRLRQQIAPKEPHVFRIHRPMKRAGRPWEEISRIAQDDEERHELEKLGISRSES